MRSPPQEEEQQEEQEQEEGYGYENIKICGVSAYACH